MTTLWDHQREAVPHMTRGHRLLAFYPGTGKTLTAITAMKEIGGKHLVIAPSSILSQWERELSKHGQKSKVIRSSKDFSLGDDDFDVALTSYHLVIRKMVWIELMKREWASLTLDESHMVKNSNAKMSHAVWGKLPAHRSICRQAERVWCLTGTPLLKDPTDLYMMLSRLWPDALEETGTNTKQKFMTYFCVYHQTPYGPNITGCQRPTALRKLLSDKMSYAGPDTKRPPLLVDTIPIDGKQIRTDGLDPDVMEALAKALGNEDPEALASLEPEMATLRRYIGEAKIVPLTNLIITELTGGHDKVAVFYQHVEVGKMVEHQLRASSYTASRIGGDVPKPEREKRLDEFINDKRVRVFLGQIQATGIGLDGLQHATDRVLIAEPQWTPGPNEQAIARVARGGSKFQSCHASYVVLSDSLDEQIMKVVRRRERDVANIITAP